MAYDAKGLEVVQVEMLRSKMVVGDVMGLIAWSSAPPTFEMVALLDLVGDNSPIQRPEEVRLVRQLLDQFLQKRPVKLICVVQQNRPRVRAREAKLCGCIEELEEKKLGVFVKLVPDEIRFFGFQDWKSGSPGHGVGSHWDFHGGIEKTF
jgi:hypothetical protein